MQWVQKKKYRECNDVCFTQLSSIVHRIPSLGFSRLSGLDLQSKVLIEIILDPCNIKARKEAARWTEAEEQALLEFLQAQVARAGDGINFKKAVFTAAANHLRERFPSKRGENKGGDKTSSSCQSK